MQQLEIHIFYSPTFTSNHCEIIEEHRHLYNAVIQLTIDMDKELNESSILLAISRKNWWYP